MVAATSTHSSQSSFLFGDWPSDHGCANEKETQASKKEKVEHCAHSDLFFYVSCGLAHLIMFGPFDAFFNKSFIIASPFVVFIFAGSHWRFVSS